MMASMAPPLLHDQRLPINIAEVARELVSQSPVRLWQATWHFITHVDGNLPRAWVVSVIQSAAVHSRPSHCEQNIADAATVPTIQHLDYIVALAQWILSPGIGPALKAATDVLCTSISPLFMRMMSLLDTVNRLMFTHAGDPIETVVVSNRGWVLQGKDEAEEHWSNTTQGYYWPFGDEMLRPQ
jgi:hypothetical protein